VDPKQKNLKINDLPVSAESLVLARSTQTK
jgi:hypothetical protein